MDRQGPTGSSRGRGRGRGRAHNPQQQGARGSHQPELGRRDAVTTAPPRAAASAGAGRGADGDGGMGKELPRSSNVQVKNDAKPGSSAEAIVVTGAGDSRGSVRGKRSIAELICSRPQECVSKVGSAGTKTRVLTNYYRLLKCPTWEMYMYRTDFSPDVDAVRARRNFLREHQVKFGGYIYDGTVIFCTGYFPDPMELMCKTADGEAQLLKVKYVGKVEDTDISKLQVLNLILRRCMHGLKLQLVGRNFFDPLAKINLLNYKMEIWPGYQTSIRQHESDILLCVEIAHKVMRTDSIYQIMMECTRDCKDYQSGFKHAVVGSVVLTDYNNKTYRVDDVDFTQNPMSTFKAGDKDMSFFDYYKQRYNLQIRDKQQPMLVSRASERDKRGGQTESILLVPELCRATGMTDAMRNNFKLMKDMSEHTRLNPERRIERLRNFNRRLQQTKESIEYLKSWDMQLDTNLVEIPARILPNEKIYFGGNSQYICDKNADWSREFRNKAMHSQIEIKRWCIIVPRRNVRDIQDFIQKCFAVARNMRMVLGEPKYSEMPDDRNGSYNQAIDAATAQDPQILLVVLPTINEDKYSCVKKKCCVDRPRASQVVTLRTVAPRDERKAAGLMSIATKVVIQMNAKLMGAPWMIDLPLKGLMTVGFDVCHSSKDKNKSYGALVATMDLTNCGSYYSAVSEHMKGQEISNEICMKLTCALHAYRTRYNALPNRILFYRDGVGDGQLHQVFDTEVQFLKMKLDEIYKSAGIETGSKFAFLVVSKRIHTRYFLNKQNPPPGTVVDDIITLPERYDFYLVSQSVRQGTVSPTSYNVIYDTMGLSADRLQMLTYKMTHMYYNWAGTCRVPAVCQYAHKLAFLVAENINRAPSNVLENQLYFL